ncbi:hypothetical protein J2T56_002132 [Natronobacillus azotifigens]|uniref:Uncharacterized protein n=1 Tax=Natronobacillus azotifigens TaxID=472978 RepID=A0A9J6REV3_9BACI|nr:hypothetical protein [Natronobacillus azotifigens]MCZ0703900.1 hypothetical protein [Natronobacillus azotifigens]
MAEEKKEKKVIHVKDLVIKAENVHFEPAQAPTQAPVPNPVPASVPGPMPRRPFDGLFGRRPMVQPAPAEPVEVQDPTNTEEETPVQEESPEATTEQGSEPVQEVQPEAQPEAQPVNQVPPRRPFSWI